MFIGSLLDNRLDSNITYSYHKRGLEDSFNPDNVKEASVGTFFTKETGNLFFKKEVSWHNHVLLREGVDIRFNIPKRCFIDHIDFTQGDTYITHPDVLRTVDSQLESIEVITTCDNEEQIIATYKGEGKSKVSTKEIRIDVGFYVDNLILRINGCSMPLSIKKLDIWAAWDIDDAIYPIPDKYERLDKSFLLTDLKTIKVLNKDEEFVADYLNEKLSYKFSYSLDKLKKESDIELEIKDSLDDAFEVITKGKKCKIIASNRRSALYGVDAFLQTIKDGKVFEATISHKEFLKTRGIHTALPGKVQLEFIDNLIKYVFVPNHYNMLYLQLSGAMRYKSFPKINEEWIRINEEYEKGRGPKPAHYGFISKDIWEHDEIKALCDKFEAYGLEVVPEIQSFGHAQYITCAYPDMAEKIDGKENEILDIGEGEMVASTKFYHTMCTNHPDYYKVIFGLIDEVIDVIKPKRYIHLGHDEIHTFGFCPRCEGASKSDILACEINKLNAYVKAKGYQMMIWGDMLQHQYYSVPYAINKVDKDIIMLDFIWYFNMDTDTEKNLLSHGFEVVMGNLYSSHFPRYKARISKPNMIGAQTSTWLKMSEDSYAYNGKMYEFIYMSELMSDKNYKEDMRLTYNEIIKPIIKELRYKILGTNPETNKKAIDKVGISKNIPFDIRDMVSYNGAIKLDAKNNTDCVLVDDYVNTITITHATDIEGYKKMWDDPVKIGEYVITYEDGSTYKKEIGYGLEIYKYKSTYGSIYNEDNFRHLGYVGTYMSVPECGKTSVGEDFTLGKFSFRNPNPSKKISKLTFNHYGNTGAKILIFDVSINK